MLTSLTSSPWSFFSLIWYLPDSACAGFLMLNMILSSCTMASTSLPVNGLPSFKIFASMVDCRVPLTTSENEKLNSNAGCCPRRRDGIYYLCTELRSWSAAIRDLLRFRRTRSPAFLLLSSLPTGTAKWVRSTCTWSHRHRSIPICWISTDVYRRPNFLFQLYNKQPVVNRNFSTLFIERRTWSIRIHL